MERERERERDAGSDEFNASLDNEFGVPIMRMPSVKKAVEAAKLPSMDEKLDTKT